MKTLKLSLLCFCCILIRCTQTDLLDNPPKDKAEIFATGLVSTPDKEHGKLSVAPDGKSMYWDFVKLPFKEGDVNKIAYVTKNNGKWGDRKIAEFCGKYRSCSPCFWGSDKIIFGKRENIGTDSVELVDDYWLIERQEGGWSEPKPLGFDQFSDTWKWSFSVAENGNIYFDDQNFFEGQHNWGMYVSYFKSGKYSEPILLPEHLNTTDFDWTPFIAPDESYLMFASNRPSSMGSTDIYITFKNHSGEWSDPINMGDKVNSKELERWPSVSPNGRIMFFLRDYLIDDQLQGQDYYWIDAKFIEELKPDELK